MKKLRVLLVHGTWGSSAVWKDDHSYFQRELQAKLADIYSAVRFDPFAWNGKQRWRARSEVATFLDQRLGECREDFNEDWEYLVVAHSHGGNIATDGVRERLRKDPTLPIKGVICLNTPFLKHELRASSAYLIAWLLLSVAFVVALTMLSNVNGESDEFVGWFRPKFDDDGLRIVLGVLAIVLSLLLLLSKLLHRNRRKEASNYLGPRPEVLCLSCPDDEAITLLGLGEGVANLPQLMLHPLAVVLVAVFTVAQFLHHSPLTWCGESQECWAVQVRWAAFAFATWVSLALAGGLLGSITIALLFGLSFRLSIETLVARVLLSYVPLRPANAYFIGISDLTLNWINPIQLFHSQIYRSPKTINEICEWIRHQAAK